MGVSGAFPRADAAAAFPFDEGRGGLRLGRGDEHHAAVDGRIHRLDGQPRPYFCPRQQAGAGRIALAVRCYHRALYHGERYPFLFYLSGLQRIGPRLYLRGHGGDPDRREPPRKEIADHGDLHDVRCGGIGRGADDRLSALRSGPAPPLHRGRADMRGVAGGGIVPCPGDLGPEAPRGGPVSDRAHHRSPRVVIPLRVYPRGDPVADRPLSEGSRSAIFRDGDNRNRF